MIMCVIITILKNQMDNFCFESMDMLHNEEKKKTKV